MKLSECERGKNYRFVKIKADKKTVRRLSELMISEGEPFVFLRSSPFKTVMIAVNGCKICLRGRMAEDIEVVQS